MPGIPTWSPASSSNACCRPRGPTAATSCALRTASCPKRSPGCSAWAHATSTPATTPTARRCAACTPTSRPSSPRNTARSRWMRRSFSWTCEPSARILTSINCAPPKTMMCALSAPGFTRSFPTRASGCASSTPPRAVAGLRNSLISWSCRWGSNPRPRPWSWPGGWEWNSTNTALPKPATSHRWPPTGKVSLCAGRFRSPRTFPSR